MKKTIIVLAIFVTATSLARELNPWLDYSVDELMKNSSLVIDGSVHSSGFRYTEETEFGNHEICGFRLIVDSVIKNETDTNIKKGMEIEFEYVTKNDQGRVYDMDSLVLHKYEKIRIFIPLRITIIKGSIRVDVKNQIHPELYGEGWKSDSPSLSAADILPRENEKPATPKWYWLTGGVVSVLVFGGLTFLLGYLSAVRKTKV